MARPVERRFVLASNNPGKLREFQELVADMELRLLPQSDFGVPAVAETGRTFVENAIIKARVAADISGLSAIADDSGIEVDILGGAPGIYSARYAGENASDEDNLQRLLDDLSAIGADRPAARYQCVIVFMKHARDPAPVITRGTWEGYIVPEPRGQNGFGYDPVFFVPSHQCTAAELQPAEKNRISHRGIAMQELLDRFRRDGC